MILEVLVVVFFLGDCGSFGGFGIIVFLSVHFSSWEVAWKHS